MLLPIASMPLPTPPPAVRDEVTKAAQAFEEVFVSHALQAAGLHRPPESMSGGAGEEMFASFLTDAHARALVTAGGIGLAEHLIRSLARQDAP